MRTLAQGCNRAAQDAKPGSLSRESEALPMSHYVIEVPVACVCLFVSFFVQTHIHIHRHRLTTSKVAHKNAK